MELFKIRGRPKPEQLWNISITYAEMFQASRFGLLRLLWVGNGSALILRLASDDGKTATVFWDEINNEIHFKEIREE
jgi:hypothetical protein